MQQVEIQFCPSAEEAGFLEIKVRLTRLAGEANAWRRINKPFLHALRKQLLMWRSLDANPRGTISICWLLLKMRRRPLSKDCRK